MKSLTLALLLTLTLAGCSGTPGTPGSPGDASCPDLADYHGGRYGGYGELQRVPATTGPAGTATRVTCDDGNGASAAEEMDVLRLRDVPLERAFLSHGQLYVRDGLDLPPEARAWFARTTCDDTGRFEVTGRWLGVESAREVRFDGDIRPPYRITAWLSDGPAAYVGTRVTVHVTAQTDPQLGPQDVKRSLWEGGQVTALVHCEQGRFVADGLTTPAGAS